MTLCGIVWLFFNVTLRSIVWLFFFSFFFFNYLLVIELASIDSSPTHTLWDQLGFSIVAAIWLSKCYFCPCFPVARDGPRQRAKGARAPPGSKNFFFLVYKIFIKKAWAPWFLAWAPLTSPIPVPTSQSRSFQEPMKTLKKKNIYIYIYV